MAAARHDEPPSFPYRIFYGRYDVLSSGGAPNVVRVCAEPFIETLVDDRVISRIVRADSDRCSLRAIGRMFSRHGPLYQMPRSYNRRLMSLSDDWNAEAAIDAIREHAVPPEAIKSERQRQWQRIPLFLHIRAKKI
jgi:hypothetical protein